MMKLEDLVPPLDLCQRIPPKAFSDSALVWGEDSTPVGYMSEVVPRPENEDAYGWIYPAPTLAEIWNDLKEYSFDVCFSANRNDRRWYAYAKHPKTVGPGRLRQEDKYSAETAALKLWMELNKRKEKK